MLYDFLYIQYINTLIYCNTTVRDLTDIYGGCAAPKGECGYISKTPSTSMLPYLCNTFNSYVQDCL